MTEKRFLRGDPQSNLGHVKIEALGTCPSVVVQEQMNMWIPIGKF